MECDINERFINSYMHDINNTNVHRLQQGEINMYDLIDMLYTCLVKNIEKDCKQCKYYGVCKISIYAPRVSIKFIEDIDYFFYSIHYAEGEC